MESGESTLNCILRSAQEEFLLYGFRGASLRRIVKNAGVTTGAFTAIFQARKLFLTRWQAACAYISGKIQSGAISF